MKFNFIFFMVCLAILSCNESSNQSPQRFEDSNIKAAFFDSTFIDKNDTLIFDSQFVFEKYKDELNGSLSIGVIPTFIYDECLDANEAAYCYVNSHESRSLRYDILSSLNYNQLKLILQKANLSAIEKKCNLKYMKEKHLSKKSNYELIIEILGLQHSPN